MRLGDLDAEELWKAVAVALGTGVLLSAVMVPAFLSGISPLPEPLGLAFAERLTGRPLPLPVGLLFHLVYVAFWSLAYLARCRARLDFGRALLLGIGLWVLVLFLFFPLVGWGFLGLAVSPRLIPASLVPHLLFALFLWGLARLAFTPRPAAAVGDR